MKKLWVGLCIIVLNLGGVMLTQANQKAEAALETGAREFEFCRSMIFQNGDDSKDVYTSVVVNVTDFDIDEMFEEVKKEYDLMNGHAKKLTIRLYDSREALKNGDCLGEKIYSDLEKN